MMRVPGAGGREGGRTRPSSPGLRPLPRGQPQPRRGQPPLEDSLRSEAFGRPPGPTPSLFCLQKESPRPPPRRTRSLPQGLYPEPRRLEEAQGGPGREDAAPRRRSALLSVPITHRWINTAGSSRTRRRGAEDARKASAEAQGRWRLSEAGSPSGTRRASSGFRGAVTSHPGPATTQQGGRGVSGGFLPKTLPALPSPVGFWGANAVNPLCQVSSGSGCSDRPEILNNPQWGWCRCVGMGRGVPTPRGGGFPRSVGCSHAPWGGSPALCGGPTLRVQGPQTVWGVPTLRGEGSHSSWGGLTLRGGASRSVGASHAL